MGTVPWFLLNVFLPEEEKHWSDHYDLLSSYMVTQMKGKWKEKKQEKQSRKEIKKKCRHQKKFWGIKLCTVKYINWCKIKCHGVFSWKSWADSALESYNRKSNREVIERRKRRLRHMPQVHGSSRYRVDESYMLASHISTIQPTHVT